ncbi:MAG: hypothetical protein FJ044_03955 [Candidatus Cloacimonetes bacterium]|nr:hypothetical protein [Candidatus Cloacimonadota bacterium]
MGKITKTYGLLLVLATIGQILESYTTYVVFFVLGYPIYSEPVGVVYERFKLTASLMLQRGEMGLVIRTIIAVSILFVLVELGRRILTLVCRWFNFKEGILVDGGFLSATIANFITWYFVANNVVSISKLV